MRRGTTTTSRPPTSRRWCRRRQRHVPRVRRRHRRAGEHEVRRHVRRLVDGRLLSEEHRSTAQPRAVRRAARCSIRAATSSVTVSGVPGARPAASTPRSASSRTSATRTGRASCYWNGSAVSDAVNPANKFFNGTRSYLGTAVSNAGDLPQLTGAANSMSGNDMDVINVDQQASCPATPAPPSAPRRAEAVLIGAFVTSIATVRARSVDQHQDRRRSEQPRGRRGPARRHARVHDQRHQQRLRHLDRHRPQRRAAGGRHVRPRVDPGDHRRQRRHQDRRGWRRSGRVHLRVAHRPRPRWGPAPPPRRAAPGPRRLVDGHVPGDGRRGDAGHGQQPGRPRTGGGLSGSLAQDYPTDGNGGDGGRPDDRTCSSSSAPDQRLQRRHAALPRQRLAAGLRGLPDGHELLAARRRSATPARTPARPAPRTPSARASAPACQASGACGACSATNIGLCGGSTPICDTPVASLRAVPGQQSVRRARRRSATPPARRCVGCLVERRLRRGDADLRSGVPRRAAPAAATASAAARRRPASRAAVRPVLGGQLVALHGRDAGLPGRRGHLRALRGQRATARARRPSATVARTPAAPAAATASAAARRPPASRRRVRPVLGHQRHALQRRDAGLLHADRRPACPARRTRSAGGRRRSATRRTHACRACAATASAGARRRPVRRAARARSARRRTRPRAAARRRSATRRRRPACRACRTRSAAGTTPVCNTTTHTCRACAGDGECGGVDAGLPAGRRVRPVLGDERRAVRRRDAGLLRGDRDLRAVHVERAVRRDDAGLQHDDAHLPRLRRRRRVRRRDAGLPAGRRVRAVLGDQRHALQRARRRSATRRARPACRARRTRSAGGRRRSATRRRTPAAPAAGTASAAARRRLARRAAPAASARRPTPPHAAARRRSATRPPATCVPCTVERAVRRDDAGLQHGDAHLPRLRRRRRVRRRDAGLPAGRRVRAVLGDNAALCAGATPVCFATAGDLRAVHVERPVRRRDADLQPARTPAAACGGDGECGGATPACQPGGACGVSARRRTPRRAAGATPACDVASRRRACRARRTRSAGARRRSATRRRTPAAPAPATASAAARRPPASRAARAASARSATPRRCTGATPVCYTPTGTACRASSNADCGGRDAGLRPASHSCRACAGDGECGGATPACQPGGACGQCSAGNALALHAARRRSASRPAGNCVACLANAECGGRDADLRSDHAHAAAACGGDGDCGGATPACQPSGACGVCSATNTTTCSGRDARLQRRAAAPACHCIVERGVRRHDAGLQHRRRTSAGPAPATASAAARRRPASRPAPAASARRRTPRSARAPRRSATRRRGNCVTCLADADCPAADARCATRRSTPAAAAPATASAAARRRPASRRGTCGQCSATNARLCTGATPLCRTRRGHLRRLPHRRPVRRHDAGVRRDHARLPRLRRRRRVRRRARRPASRAARAASARPANATRCTGATPACDVGARRLRRLHLERAVRRGRRRSAISPPAPAAPARATASAAARRRPASRPAPAASARPRTAPAAPARLPLCYTPIGVCVECLDSSVCAGAEAGVRSDPARLPRLAAPTTSAAACCPPASRPALAASARRRTPPAARGATPVCETGRRHLRRLPDERRVRRDEAGLRRRGAVVPGLRVGRRMRAGGADLPAQRRLRALHGDRRLALPDAAPALRRLVGRRRLRRLPHRQPVRRRHAGLRDGDAHLRRLHHRRRAELPDPGAPGLPAHGPAARRLHRVRRDERHPVRRREAGLRRGPRRLRLRGADGRSLLRRRRLRPHLQRRGRLLRARLRPGAAQRLPDRTELPRRHERRRPVLGRDRATATRTAARRSPDCDLQRRAGRALRAVPLRPPTATRRWSATRPRRSASSARRARTDQCRPELAGSQCLTDGRCGCLVDADCGGVTSGRVCDAAASRCVPGCRGTGGNGCVNEMVCSSTTDEIGRCDERPMTDGGVDGAPTERRRRGRRGRPRPDAGAGDARDVGGIADAGARRRQRARRLRRTTGARRRTRRHRMPVTPSMAAATAAPTR